MEENNIETPIIDAPITEEPITTDTPPAPDKDLKTLLDELKTEFTAKLQEQKADYEAKLKERDDYIKSLLTATAPSQSQSIADKINAKRDFKKW